MTQDAAAVSRERAQAWLKLQGYQPTTLHISAFKRLGGRLTAANIAFDDHPNEKRFTDRIETVTVDSVFTWLNRSGLGGSHRIFAADLYHAKVDHIFVVLPFRILLQGVETFRVGYPLRKFDDVTIFLLIFRGLRQRAVDKAFFVPLEVCSVAGRAVKNEGTLRRRELNLQSL